jgi:hypothetical protein
LSGSQWSPHASDLLSLNQRRFMLRADVCARMVLPMNSAGTILVTGNTYPVKDAIKALGGRWDNASKGWRVPANNATAARALVAVPGTPIASRVSADRAFVARKMAAGICCCGVCEGDGDGDQVCDRLR